MSRKLCMNSEIAILKYLMTVTREKNDQLKIASHFLSAILQLLLFLNLTTCHNIEFSKKITANIRPSYIINIVSVGIYRVKILTC